MKGGQKHKDKITRRKSRNSRKSSSKRINRVRRLSKDKNIRRSKNRNSRRKSNRKSRRVNRNNKKTRRRRRKSKSKKLKGGGRFMDRFVADLMGDMIQTGIISQDPETEQKAVNIFADIIGPSTKRSVQAVFRGENLQDHLQRPIATAPTTASSEPTTAPGALPNLKFRVVHQATVRTGYETDSERVSKVSPGTVISCLERKTNSDGAVRVRYNAGWVSVVAYDGTVILEQVDDSTPTVEEEDPSPSPPEITDADATLFTNDMEPGLYHLYTRNTKDKGTYYIYLIDSKAGDTGDKVYYVHLESDKEISYSEAGKKRWWRKSNIAPSTEVIEGSKFDYKALGMSDLLAMVDHESSESKLYCVSIQTPKINQKLPVKGFELDEKAELLCLYFVGMTVGKNQKYVRFAYPSPTGPKITKHMMFHTCDGIIKLGDNPVFQLVSCNLPVTSEDATKMASAISGELIAAAGVIQGGEQTPFSAFNDRLVPYDPQQKKQTHHYLKITSNSGEKVFEYADGQLVDSQDLNSKPLFYAKWQKHDESSKAYIRIPLFTYQNVTWQDIFFFKGSPETPDISIHKGIRVHKEKQKILLNEYDSTEYNIAATKLVDRYRDARETNFVLVISRLCTTGRTAEAGGVGQGIIACSPVTPAMIGEILNGVSYDLDPTAVADDMANAAIGGLLATAQVGGPLNGGQTAIVEEIKACLQTRDARAQKVGGLTATFCPKNWNLWFDAVKEEMGPTNFENCESQLRCLPKWGEQSHEAFNNGFAQETSTNSSNGTLRAVGHKAYASKSGLEMYKDRFCSKYEEEQNVDGLDLALLATKKTFLGLCTMWIGPKTSPPPGTAGYTDAGGLLGRTQRYGLTWCLEKKLEERRFRAADALNTAHLRETCIGIFPGAGAPGGILTVPDGGTGGAGPQVGRWHSAAGSILGTLPAYATLADAGPPSDGAGVNLVEAKSIVDTFSRLGCSFTTNNFNGDLEAAINAVHKSHSASSNDVTKLFNHINTNSYNGDANVLAIDPPTTLGGTAFVAVQPAAGGEPSYPAFGIPLPILSLNFVGH